MNAWQRFAGVAGLTLLPLGTAMSAACPGASAFTDVAASDSFCTDAQWLSNRLVTQGCGAGVFCPSDNVTRAQMALFMQRLGTVLSPLRLERAEFEQEIDPVPTLSQPTDPSVVVCETAEVAAVGYPRVVQLTGWFSFRAVGGNGLMHIYPATSNDGGTTWGRVGGLYYAAQTMLAGTHSTFPMSVAISLPAGTALRAGLYPRRFSGTTVSIDSGECRVNLLVFSQTGASPPYDAAQDASEARE